MLWRSEHLSTRVLTKHTRVEVKCHEVRSSVCDSERKAGDDGALGDSGDALGLDSGPVGASVRGRQPFSLQGRLCKGRTYPVTSHCLFKCCQISSQELMKGSNPSQNSLLGFPRRGRIAALTPRTWWPSSPRRRPLERLVSGLFLKRRLSLGRGGEGRGGPPDCVGSGAAFPLGRP